MKNILLICLGILFSINAFSEDSIEAERISDENAFYFYESRAEIRSPEHKLAGFISNEYKNARDEFTKHDLFQQIKPVLNKRLAKAKGQKVVFVGVNSKLGDYDFDKKAFPSGFSETTFIPFDHSYAVSFVNASEIEYIPKELDSARKLASELRRSRNATFKITGEIVSVEEKTLNYRPSKVINIKINEVNTFLQSGKEIAKIKL